MHPDKKVGMALGILLVGIVGAFFFRNDVDATRPTAPRQLSSAEVLDEQIRQGVRVPYLPDRASDAETDVTVPRINIAELIEGISEPGSDVPSEPVSIPDPIRIDGTGTLAVTPDREGSGEVHDILPPAVPSPAEPGGVSANGGSLKTSPATAWTVHEVGTGETLSGLASKYLGTHRRYNELFDFNRDILTSPDALRVGMKLRIPNQKKNPVPAPKAAAAPASPSELTRPGNTPAEVEPDEPRTPARPQFVRPNGNVPRISANPSRSLGQLPPPGVPHVEGLDTAYNRRHTDSKSARRDKLSDGSSETRSQ